eukprot:scaffold23495_cov112-Isochrysis_galbana.AAC.2
MDRNRQAETNGAHPNRRAMRYQSMRVASKPGQSVGGPGCVAVANTHIGTYMRLLVARCGSWLECAWERQLNRRKIQ